MSRVRLEWQGKRTQVERFPLPLQVVETVNASRASRGTLDAEYEAASTWRNRLIWGDNRYVLASLAEELAGKVDLVYIDPPFDSRQDYKVRIAIGEASGDQDLSKLQSVIEEKAYRDTWGAGVDSYLQMLYDRLVLLRDLLSDRGSIFLHLAPNVSHVGRALLDEVFGADNLRAEIVWRRTTAHADAHDFATVHDAILCFSKTQQHVWHAQFEPYTDEYVRQYYHYDDGDGRKYWPGDLTAAGRRSGSSGRPWRGFNPADKGLHWRFAVETLDELDAEGRIYWPKKVSGWPQYKRYLDTMRGMPVGDVWTDIKRINQVAHERLGYDTQKPEALLERIIRSSSDPGSIVLDCFAGSGTTAAVAEKLGRRWVACDIGRFAIHTTRKRLLDIPGCAPFVVANLGRYERQVWQRATTGAELRAYLDFIVDLYSAKPLNGFLHLHGQLGTRAVHVGGVDAAVGVPEITDALDECAAGGWTALDVLGWEWELGLHELVTDAARDRGLDLRLRKIPTDVMDPRAVASGEITFHELAHVRADLGVRGRDLSVTLTDFVLPNPGLAPEGVREKVTGWADYIDYWAVDFDSAGDTFHNQWQSYRTRASRALELSAAHRYEQPGRVTVLVKVVDVFGNDTTVALEARIR